MAGRVRGGCGALMRQSALVGGRRRWVSVGPGRSRSVPEFPEFLPFPDRGLRRGSSASLSRMHVKALHALRAA